MNTTTMSDFDAIFSSLQSALERELAPIELMVILFYSGKSFYEKKESVKWTLYAPYIKKTIDYIVSKFHLIEHKQLIDHLLEKMASTPNMCVSLYISSIESYCKDIYRKKMYEAKSSYETTGNVSDRIIMESYYNDYIQLYVKDICTFFIYLDHQEEITNMLCAAYPTKITKEEVNVTFQVCQSGKGAAFLIKLIEKLMNEKSGCNTNVKDFLFQITKNQIPTIYFKIDQLNTKLEEINNKIERICVKYEQDENFAKSADLITRVENTIVSRTKVELESPNADSLDSTFNRIAREEIRANQLNLSEFVENMLIDFFQTAKAMIRLGSTLDNVGNLLSNLSLNG